MKETKDQAHGVRVPRQDRARQKVELILEAAMRLLDSEGERGGMAMLTTNAVAHKAGVSIGTLYQYFPNKAAILDALVDQEMAAMSARVLAVLEADGAMPHGARIGRIVAAVAASYGERRRVHRLVLEHSLTRGLARMEPLIARIIAMLQAGGGPAEAPMAEADAFVLTNAFVGVMRAMVTRADASHPSQSEIEETLGRLIVGFVARG